MNAIGSIEGVSSLAGSLFETSPVANEKLEVTRFGDLLKSMVNDTDQAQKTADGTLKAFEKGEVQDVHEVTVAMSKADLSFRLMLEVRSRLMESYQTIMRSQV